MENTMQPKKNMKTVYGVLAMALLVLCGVGQANAAEPAAAEQSGGFASGLTNAISDFQAKLPAMFREPAPEDFGNKPRLKTHFGATSSFTSDADLTDKETSPAWLARASAGLTLELPIGERLYTEADYTFSFGSAQGGEVSATTVTHNARLLARYKLTEDTQLGLKHNIAWSQIPGTLDEEMFILNSTTAEVSHRFSDILVGNVSDTFQWFEDKNDSTDGSLNQEFMDNTVDAGLAYDVSERVTLSPSASWGIRNFSNIEGKDYWNVAYKLGASYEVGPQTTLYTHVGHNIRQFNQGSNQNDQAIIYGASVVNSISRRLAWSLSYDRNVADTFDTSFLNREGREATNLDNLDRNFRVMRTNRFGTAASYNMTERHTFRLFGDLLFTETEAEDNVVRLTENDETMLEFGPSYSYRLNKYVSFDLRYVFGRRFSNDDSGSGRQNYTFNNFGGGLTLSV